jgi:hypothetical protein
VSRASQKEAPAKRKLLISPPLSLAIVEIIQIFEGLARNLARFGDHIPGGDAATHWTRIDHAGLPRSRDTSGNRLGLSLAQFSQGQISPPAEPLQTDALDMAVSGENYLRYTGTLPMLMQTSYPTRVNAVAA